jgi:hypothetical protein
VSEDLFRIRFSGQTQALISRAIKVSPALGKKVEEYASDVLFKATKLAEEAAKSVVPIDGGQLRQDIDSNISSNYSGTSVVFVDPVDHINKRGNSFYRRGGESNPNTRVIGSPALADLLNVTNFNRSKRSQATAPYHGVTGSTKGWEDDARDQFLIQLKRMIVSGRK